MNAAVHSNKGQAPSIDEAIHPVVLPGVSNMASSQQSYDIEEALWQCEELASSIRAVSEISYGEGNGQDGVGRFESLSPNDLHALLKLFSVTLTLRLENVRSIIESTRKPSR